MCYHFNAILEKDFQEGSEKLEKVCLELEEKLHHIYMISGRCTKVLEVLLGTHDKQSMLRDHSIHKKSEVVCKAVSTQIFFFEDTAV